jgi:hypothetical protein
MLSNWAKALSAALAMGVALAAAPAAHAGAGYFTTHDLTASAGVPLGSNQTAGWSTPWDLQRHIAYVSRDSRLIVASSAPGSADWNWTTARADAGYAFGFLSTYTYSWDHSSHIIYADGGNHHLMETWSSQTSPVWQTVDLTATYNGPLLEYDPHGYEQDGQQHIVFQGADPTNVIWEATFAPGIGWRFTNLTAQTGIHPQYNNGEYLTAASLGADGEAIGYIGDDQYPHVLVGRGGRWADQRVGTLADHDYYNLISMVFLRDNHVVRYTLRYSAGGHMHVATWTSGSGWADTDVSAVAPVPDREFPWSGNDAYAWNADGSDHLYCTAPDGAVREYVRTRAGVWYLWTDTGPIVDGPAWVAGFATPDDNVHGTETEFYVYWDSDYHLMVADLTVPYVA